MGRRGNFGEAGDRNIVSKLEGEKDPEGFKKNVSERKIEKILKVEKDSF